LTQTGSVLRTGQTATVPYQVDTNATGVSTLAITISSVTKGSITDLKDFQLDASSKQGTPYYVSATFKNVGDKAVKPSGIFGVIEVQDAAGDALNDLTLLGDFSKCQGTEPDSLAVGASFTLCDVYIAPAGTSATKVVFDNFVDTSATDSSETTITWTAS
jgi:hypothetical protein